MLRTATAAALRASRGASNGIQPSKIALASHGKSAECTWSPASRSAARKISTSSSARINPTASNNCGLLRLKQFVWHEQTTNHAMAAAALAASALLFHGAAWQESVQTEGTAESSLEEQREFDWDDFMYRAIKPGEDDDDDDEDDDDEDEEEEEEEDEVNEDGDGIEDKGNEVDEEATTSSSSQPFDAAALQAWLHDKMISSDAYSPDELLDAFLAEMESGLQSNSRSSLAMIPSFVEANASLPPSSSVAVIDAGGTNLRICIVKTDDNGKLMVDERAKLYNNNIPGKDAEISPADFYKVLVDQLAPYADQFDRIGFCFSYPANISRDADGNIDGKLTHWTKEIKIPDMENTYVGRGLLDALKEQGIDNKKVVVLNDTVACLLAGISKGQEMDASSYIGFILGTGTNTAYVQPNGGIAKLGDDIDPNASQVINVESGGFSAFQRSPIDVELDKGPDEPKDKDLAALHFQAQGSGTHVFEKTISGEYLGTITLALLHKLVAEHADAFSEEGGDVIKNMGTLENFHASNFAHGETTDDKSGNLSNEAFSDDDKDIIRSVYNSVVDRAALFTSVNILAGVVKSGEGKDKAQPVCVNIDGSTYWKTFGLKEKVQERLSKMSKDRGLHIECVGVEDAPVIGAAIAGLTGLAD